MSEELLSAIERDPDDPQPYLVYADWLQNQGDPRGELITLQHAMSVLDDSAEFLRLKQRQEELFEDHERHFFGDAIPFRPLMKLKWRWGFLERVAVSTRNDLESANDAATAILETPSARFIKWLGVLPSSRETETLQSAIDSLASRKRHTLTRLTLGASLFSTVGDVTNLAHALPKLRQLHIFGSVTCRRWRFPSLEQLEICAVGVNASTWQPILESDGFPQLSWLRLVRAEGRDQLVRDLIRSPLLEQIRTLSIDGPSEIDTMRALITKLESLERHLGLTIEQDPPPLFGEDVERLAALVPEFEYGPEHPST